MTIDDKWRELLGIVQATIKLDEEVFLNAIKNGGTCRETMLADKLHPVKPWTMHETFNYFNTDYTRKHAAKS